METAPAIVPQPREMTLAAGQFNARSARWQLSPQAGSHRAIAHKLATLRLRPDSQGRPGWALTAGDAPAIAAPEKPQGYALTITPTGLALAGADADGLFWGLVTLEQLLEQATDDARSLPALEIRDWPEVLLRGHHDDVSRKQISKLEDFKRIVRLLSRYKLNVYTPYMEDVLHLESFPDIGEGRGKLMPDEVAELHAEAALHNVQIMPTFSLAGHQENLLTLPRYRHLAAKTFQPPSSLDSANPAVREYLAQAIDDVCRMFAGKYFHMAFDEVIGLDEERFFTHANWCAEQLVAHGKTPVMWVDMVYNHYGYDKIHRLHPAIIAVNWQYGGRTNEGRVKHHDELVAQGRPVWGLAGYSNWCAFLPKSRSTYAHFAQWMAQLERTPTASLMCSMWGDNGYENHRDLTWNLYASFGEHTWSGPAAAMDSFEARFQTTFYGLELPELTEHVYALPERLSLAPNQYWKLHRLGAVGMLRFVHSQPELGAKLADDRRQLQAALEALDGLRAKVKKEKRHLDHVESALRRTLSVVNRLALAYRQLEGLTGPALKAAAREILRELQQTRRVYAASWLATNRPENLEVSLAVFDEVAESYRTLGRKVPAVGPKGRYTPLALPYNANHVEIGSLPVGPALVNGVPFQFAPLQGQTHLALQGPGQSLRLQLAGEPVNDLHLIVSLQSPADKQPLPAVRAELRRDGRCVWTEDLLAIRHLCDWWAIRGEHIWAGGGFAYVDPMRVRYGLKTNTYYAVTHLANFPWVGRIRADELVLTMLSDREMQLFALTVES